VDRQAVPAGPVPGAKNSPVTKLPTDAQIQGGGSRAFVAARGLAEEHSAEYFLIDAGPRGDVFQRWDPQHLVYGGMLSAGEGPVEPRRFRRTTRNTGISAVPESTRNDP